MRILLTGATGHIGKRLLPVLRTKDFGEECIGTFTSRFVHLFLNEC